MQSRQLFRENDTKIIRTDIGNVFEHYIQIKMKHYLREFDSMMTKDQPLNRTFLLDNVTKNCFIDGAKGVEFDLYLPTAYPLFRISTFLSEYEVEHVFSRGSAPSTEVLLVMETCLKGITKNKQLKQQLHFLYQYCSAFGGVARSPISYMVVNASPSTKNEVVALLRGIISTFPGRVEDVFESISVVCIPCFNEKIVGDLVIVTSELQNHASWTNCTINSIMDEFHENAERTALILSEMKVELAEIKAENAELKAENAIIKAENAELKAENAELKAELAEVKATNVSIMARLSALESRM